MGFCVKCGNSINEGDSFCVNCGAPVYKDPNNNSFLNEIDVKPIKPDIEEVVKISRPSFVKYVNDYVNETTTYGNVEELLSKGGRQKHIVWCYGVPVIAALILTLFRSENLLDLGFIFLLLFALGIGFVLTASIDLIKAGKIMFNSSARVNKRIDPDKFMDFLNTQLGVIPQFSNEWNYIKYVGFGLGGMAAAGVGNLLTAGSSRIGSRFSNRHCMIEFVLVPGDDKEGTPHTDYSISVAYNSFIHYSLKAPCIEKAMPILKAAINYYVLYY